MASLKATVTSLEDRLCLIAEQTDDSTILEPKPVVADEDQKFTEGSLWFVVTDN